MTREQGVFRPGARLSRGRPSADPRLGCPRKVEKKVLDIDPILGSTWGHARTNQIVQDADACSVAGRPIKARRRGWSQHCEPDSETLRRLHSTSGATARPIVCVWRCDTVKRVRRLLMMLPGWRYGRSRVSAELSMRTGHSDWKVLGIPRSSGVA